MTIRKLALALGLLSLFPLAAAAPSLASSLGGGGGGHLSQCLDGCDQAFGGCLIYPGVGCEEERNACYQSCYEWYGG